LSFLHLRDGKESEIFKKLLAFVSSIPSGPKQTEDDEASTNSQENQIFEQSASSGNIIASTKMKIDLPLPSVDEDNNPIRQEGNIENALGSIKMRTDLPFKPVSQKGNVVAVLLDIQEVKDEVTLAVEEPVKRANGLISDEEGELRGTTLNTGFGQGELKSSPMVGFPLLPASNDIIVGSATKFVDRLTALLNVDGTVDEVLDETVPDDGTVPSGGSPEKLRLLQVRSPEVRAAIQNVAKKVFSEFEDLPNAECIGLSLGKNGSLHLDTSVLVSQLTSNKEETVNGMKGLGNTIYERINYLMHPYAGMYTDDKNILQLRATQKDEGASLPDRESSKEQIALEKRLNELKLLMERSRLLTEWFTQNEKISADNSEEASGDT
jgi:hypothetical protein